MLWPASYKIVFQFETSTICFCVPFGPRIKICFQNVFLTIFSGVVIWVVVCLEDTSVIYALALKFILYTKLSMFYNVFDMGFKNT